MAKIKRKCGKCGRIGHNRATCKNKTKKKPKKTSGKAKKKTKKKKPGRKCGKCGRAGHNKATCKNKKKKKKGTKRRTTTRSTGSRRLVGGGRGWKLFHYAGTTAKGNVSNKTWGIKISGKKVWTHHGKTWGIKKSTPKTFSTAAAARKYYNAKLAEKRRKGYCFAGSNRRRRSRR